MRHLRETLKNDRPRLPVAGLFDLSIPVPIEDFD